MDNLTQARLVPLTGLSVEAVGWPNLVTNSQGNVRDVLIGPKGPCSIPWWAPRRGVQVIPVPDTRCIKVDPTVGGLSVTMDS